MPKPYSKDLRERVIESIEAGASRREAAELYGISPSVAVIWAQRWKATGSIAAKPSGGIPDPGFAAIDDGHQFAKPHSVT